MDRLNTGRVVDVGNGGQIRPLEVQLIAQIHRIVPRREGFAPLLGHGMHQQHVGRNAIVVEVLSAVFGQNRRRKGPERFAVLDFQIQLLLHLGIARVAQDAATTQGARAELHASLHPADHVAVGQ